MRTISICAAPLIALAVWAAPASAQTFNASCVKGADTRTIEVVEPGTVGEACDVRYTLGPDTVRTPYHANNSREFCAVKANEMMANLISEGFACGKAGGALTVEARAPAPEPEPAPNPAPEPEPDLAPSGDQTADESADAPSPETILGATLMTSRPGSDAQETPPLESAPIEGALAADASPQTVAPETVAPETVAPETASPETAPLETLRAEPVAMIATADNAPSGATRGPSTLAGVSLETLQQAARPIPVGQIVGAEPDLAAGAAPAPVSPPDAEERAPAAPRTEPGALRAPQDIIRATIDAQTAAWNEGNLEAFMEGYWRDDNLKFISGTRVAKGWSSVMKRYSADYGDGSGLGNLSIDNRDVEMVTDDVAVVTGRFQHQSTDGTDASGVFTLVMRRMDGVWRIVHDHSVSDPQADQ